MSEEIVMEGRKVIGGFAEGKAIVSHEPVMGWGNVDPKKGVITERNHEIKDKPLKGKVFVFPYPRGSGGWIKFGAMPLYDTNPVAMVYWKGNALTNLGALVMKVPTVASFDTNPTKIIETGDHVKVNGDEGRIKIIKK